MPSIVRVELADVVSGLRAAAMDALIGSVVIEATKTGESAMLPWPLILSAADDDNVTAPKAALTFPPVRGVAEALHAKSPSKVVDVATIGSLAVALLVRLPNGAVSDPVRLSAACAAMDKASKDAVNSPVIASAACALAVRSSSVTDALAETLPPPPVEYSSRAKNRPALSAVGVNAGLLVSSVDVLTLNSPRSEMGLDVEDRNVDSAV